jgi:uncharacterized protein YndB with AHSA1/START domain
VTEPAQLDLVLEEVYAHPIEKVWAAVTDTEHLAVWLMQNDFEPRVGKSLHLAGRAGARLARLGELRSARATPAASHGLVVDCRR